MFKTNLKVAWRNLLKDKQFTLLNVLGLSAGIACALLIFLWANDELNFDKFFANNDRMYQLMEHQGSDGVSDGSTGMLSAAVALQCPEVEYASPLAPPGWFPKFTLSVDDKNIKAAGQYAGKDYFNIFSFKMLDGDKNAVLANRKSIVISNELAKKLFGTESHLIGKPIRFQHDSTFYVSGVFESTPYHSSQQFDFVLSWDYFKKVQDWVTNWNNIGPLNFVLLKKGTNVEAFNKKIAGIIIANGGDTSRRAFATKFSEVYLHNNVGVNSGSSARMQSVQLFSMVALFILIIACVNFMNLSTAKASRRMKEVGVKKVVGANRRQLIFQFLTESVLLTFFSAIVAVIIAWQLLPAFNQLSGKSITLQVDAKIIFSFIAIILFTGLLAGSYPALYLSKFNPLTILKGKLNTSLAEVFSRKGLVIFQFTLSSVLIVAVIIIYQQTQFIQSVNPGYNKENIVRIEAEGKIQGNETTFINELKKIQGVTDASYTFANIVGHTYGDYGLQWTGADPNKGTYFEVFGGGHDLIKTLGMQLTSGRAFSKDFGTDTSAIILNETAVKVMNLKEPIGQTVQLYRHPMQVIGVVKDFHFESLHETVKPAYILLQPHGGKILARVNANNQRQTIASIQNLYESYNPGFPFSFSFLDEAYQRQYDSETRISILSKYFAALAIIISSLGLFGLAAFTAQKRRKEIGIRKVIGASVSNIASMLSKDFLQLIVLSLLIAFPISWWLMNNWLQSFAYRISIGPTVFIDAGLIVTLITLATISFQSIKAALMNPVKSLRNE